MTTHNKHLILGFTGGIGRAVAQGSRNILAVGFLKKMGELKGKILK
jgi:hypothetical protein